ncbi:bacillithiol system redox-active protein YtxJ [uncultured Flavobacterium sp.]|uniref:bacillithiol system redox-active protein YtxJ n=1 Tax=uncultured Flavobacterium sp. TaxID=165435 RepID=UPI0030EE0C63|tara:strand:+ start:411 stop:809 length:399 start_codon:yes stop_codon:yes gene_type:complete
MGFLDKIFGGNAPEEKNEKKVEAKFYILDDVKLLDQVDVISQTKPVVIFKHSTRCSISRFALKRFEAEFNYDEDKIDWYLLDLLNHRDISNEMAHRYNVQHQSPQIIVVRNGKAIYHDSHDGIDANDLKQFI